LTTKTGVSYNINMIFNILKDQAAPDKILQRIGAAAWGR
jgi:hypothetical protein